MRVAGRAENTYILVHLQAHGTRGLGHHLPGHVHGCRRCGVSNNRRGDHQLCGLTPSELLGGTHGGGEVGLGNLVNHLGGNGERLVNGVDARELGSVELIRQADGVGDPVLLELARSRKLLGVLHSVKSAGATDGEAGDGVAHRRIDLGRGVVRDVKLEAGIAVHVKVGGRSSEHKVLASKHLHEHL